MSRKIDRIFQPGIATWTFISDDWRSTHYPNHAAVKLGGYYGKCETDAQYCTLKLMKVFTAIEERDEIISSILMEKTNMENVHCKP
jgi:hypothetical protein